MRINYNEFKENMDNADPRSPGGIDVNRTVLSDSVFYFRKNGFLFDCIESYRDHERSIDMYLSLANEDVCKFYIGNCPFEMLNKGNEDLMMNFLDTLIIRFGDYVKEETARIKEASEKA